MAVNEVIYDGDTLISLANDTVTESTLASGVTAHDASGNPITGTANYVLSVNDIIPDENGNVKLSQVDWEETSEESPVFIKNKPNVATQEYVQEQIATFDFIKVVDVLPETGLINKFYLVPKATSEQTNQMDLFDEYVWIIPEGETEGKWEWVTTKQIEVDLTAYATSAAVDAAILARSKAEHPVGSIYLSITSTNPSTFFGFGSWSLIAQNRMMIGAGSTYAARATGGAATVTLSAKQVPKVEGRISMHNGYTATNVHQVDGCFSAGITNEKYILEGSGTSGSQSVGQIRFSNGGNGEAHNNLPPYFGVYIWQRTA